MAPWRTSPPILAVAVRLGSATISGGIVLALFVLGATVGLGQSQAPSMAVGNARREVDLFKTEPFDRITLPDNTVWDIEPVSPRPLPPIDSKRAKARKALAEKAIPEGGNIGLIGEKSKILTEREKAKEEEQDQMVIHLIDGEVRDYKVRRDSIKNIEYFEDLLIAEADRRITARDFTKAFELLLLVETRQPNWKGLSEKVDRLLYEEGSEALSNLDGEKGLRLLFELHARNKGFPGLADRLANSFSKRIDTAYRVEDFPRGRQVLQEFRTVVPDHTLVKEATNRFVNRAKELVEKSKRANPTQKLDQLIEAARTWPSLDGLESAYNDAYRAEPLLEVAVTDVANPIGPWSGSPALKRISRLLYVPLLGSDDESALKGTRTDQLMTGVENGELGRTVKIKIRESFEWSDQSRPVSSIDVARSLADRAQPASPAYSARWANLLERITLVDETEVDLMFSRPTMKPEAWLVTPVGPAHASADGWVALRGADRRPVGDGPFQWVSGTPAVTQYRRTEPVSPPTPKVIRLRERRFNTPDDAHVAFLAGQVSLIEHVASDQVPEFRKNPDVKVGTYTTPLLQFLAIDGRNPVLRNRSLRRAISLAIDRKLLLEETLLKAKPNDKNFVSDGPFPKGSYVDAPDVPPFEYDPLLAKMLLVAARRELGGSGWDKIKFEYPATPEARAICPRIIEALALTGLEVQPIEVNESELETGLRSGRRFDIAYRSIRMSEPFLEAGPLLCPGYDAPPDTEAVAAIASPRIMQLLLQMDRAPESASVRGLLIQIDRETRDELPIIPLWQLEDHYAWRSRLKGPAETTANLYDGIQSWEIEPWFARDPW